MVFQSANLLPWMTAYENVMLGVNQVYFTSSKKERSTDGRVLPHHRSVWATAMQKHPGELSQGMRQRVGIARAFALAAQDAAARRALRHARLAHRYELQEVLLELWRRNRITTLMVTHDVDEAIFLSDRVVMMTDGPEAEVGDILKIPFERPRNRKEIMEDPRYYELREHLISFLNDRSHIRPSREPQFKPSPDMAAELAAHAFPFPTAAA
jgi:nitrate/nitrite transport system ATP-binding protein